MRVELALRDLQPLAPERQHLAPRLFAPMRIAHADVSSLIIER